MATIPKVVRPLPREIDLDRHLAFAAAFGWLRAGWQDLKINPLPSLFFGLAILGLSYAIIASLKILAYDYFLFPLLAGFMVVGPALAIGLYEKSRLIAAGEPISLARLILVRPKSGGQVLFVGLLLCLVMMLWIRAAVLIYALFFGLLPFPGLDHITAMLFSTQIGLALLIVGSLVGAIFAAFSFAISVFSFPMLLNERSDALTAMGTSMALVWNNLPLMLTWGAIVLLLFLASLLTGLLGLILIYPLLGHATWHAYMAIRQPVKANSNAIISS